MKPKYAQFFVSLTLLTLALAGIAWLLDYMLLQQVVSQAYPFILILFYLVTAVVHIVLLRITYLSPRRFVSYFMLATLGKLVIYFTAVLIYIFTFQENILAFILTFLAIYLFYTVFEVVLILSQTKHIVPGK